MTQPMSWFGALVSRGAQSSISQGHRNTGEAGKGSTDLRPRVPEASREANNTREGKDRDDRSLRSGLGSILNRENSASNARTTVKLDDVEKASVRFEEVEKGSTTGSYAALRVARGPRVIIHNSDDDEEEFDIDDEADMDEDEDEEDDVEDYGGSVKIDEKGSVHGSYASLRIAGSPRVSVRRFGAEEEAYRVSGKLDEADKDSNAQSYASLRIAASPGAKVRRSDDEEHEVAVEADGVSTKLDQAEKASISESYASLKIASSSQVKVRASDDDNEEVDVDDYGESASGEEYSGESEYEPGEEDEEEEEQAYQSEESFEDVDGGFSGYAKIKVIDTEVADEKSLDRKHSPYARISVRDVPDVEYKTYITQDYLPYSEISSPDNHLKEDRVETGYTKVSVAGSSEVDYNYGETVARGSVVGSDGKEMDRESFSGRARVVRAGSDVDKYARISIAGSDHERSYDLGHLAYGKISVVGSDHGREMEKELIGFARVSVVGSDHEHGREADDMSSHARFSVVENEDLNAEYAKISATNSGLEYGEDNETGYAPHMKASDIESDLKIQKDRNEFYFESDRSEKDIPTVEVVHIDDAVRNEEDRDDDVYEAYLELSSEMRAKLEYQMRVVLVCSIFESSKKLSEFPAVYRKKFGKEVETTGFRSASRLCRAMPHIVQRSRLEKDGELWLVDSAKNRRAVAGIRSGLRRLVYDMLLKWDGRMSYDQLQEQCSETLGKPLEDILAEHGYDNPSVEALVKDLPDLVRCEKSDSKHWAVLSVDAEDPALSDGILMISKGISHESEKRPANHLENVLEEVTDMITNMIPDKVSMASAKVTMRGLRKEFKKQNYVAESTSAFEREIVRARFSIRVLLAFSNRGQGVELSKLLDLYETSFSENLNIRLLGFGSELELAKSWNDICLVHDNDPEWVFLIPLEANKRILNTLRTGLRSSVHSILSEAESNGLQLSDFLRKIVEFENGKLVEDLQYSGYNCFEPDKLDELLGSKSQLAEFDDLRLLLDEMMDFVRLGSDEDGSLLVKLRDWGDVLPMLNLADCKIGEAEIGNFDELFVNLMLHALNDEEEDDLDDGSEYGTEATRVPEGATVPLGLVAQRVESFESGVPLRAVHSPTPASLRFKHEIRMILGSPEYSESGIAWIDFNNIYKDRTGQDLGSRARLKQLLRNMPDVVCKESLTEKCARLAKTHKNLRILRAVRNGYRQVLWWASVFSAAGLWANLLDGWFIDLVGRSFSSCLQDCGYETSRSRPLSSVSCFLKDMSDLFERPSSHFEVYKWAGGAEDPIHSDASLLGLSELAIQFDPSRVFSSRKELEGNSLVVDEKDHQVGKQTSSKSGVNSYGAPCQLDLSDAPSF